MGAQYSALYPLSSTMYRIFDLGGGKPVEIGLIAALVYIGWGLERTARSVRGLHVEMCNARWERAERKKLESERCNDRSAALNRHGVESGD